MTRPPTTLSAEEQARVAEALRLQKDVKKAVGANDELSSKITDRLNAALAPPAEDPEENARLKAELNELLVSELDSSKQITHTLSPQASLSLMQPVGAELVGPEEKDDEDDEQNPEDVVSVNLSGTKALSIPATSWWSSSWLNPSNWFKADIDEDEDEDDDDEHALDVTPDPKTERPAVLPADNPEQKPASGFFSTLSHKIKNLFGFQQIQSLRDDNPSPPPTSSATHKAESPPKSDAKIPIPSNPIIIPPPKTATPVVITNICNIMNRNDQIKHPIQSETIASSDSHNNSTHFIVSLKPDTTSNPLSEPVSEQVEFNITTPIDEKSTQPTYMKLLKSDSATSEQTQAAFAQCIIDAAQAYRISYQKAHHGHGGNILVLRNSISENIRNAVERLNNSFADDKKFTIQVLAPKAKPTFS